MLQAYSRFRLIGLITMVWIVCVLLVNAPLVAHSDTYVTYTPVFTSDDCVLAELCQFAADNLDYAVKCGFLVLSKEHSQLPFHFQ